MIVVSHRPPLKRVDFTPKPRVVEPPTESAGTIALRELGAQLEQERIWSIVQQTARGCNGVEA